MPLTIKSDIPNTTDESDQSHYTLAMLMMATGVPSLRKGNADDLMKLVSRAILLDILPKHNGETVTVAVFVEWVRLFGNVHTNASKRTDLDVRKSAQAHAESIARYAIKGD